MRRGAVACLVAAALVVGCAGADGSIGDGGSGNDGGLGCRASIQFQPAEAIAGAGVYVRANGDVDGDPGFVTYAWTIVDESGSDLPLTSVGAGGRDVEFEIADPGVYVAMLEVNGGACASASASFTAIAPGALDVPYRLRVVPPPTSSTPPIERVQLVRGGGDADLGTVTLDFGILVDGEVASAAGPEAAYVRLSPVGSPDLWIETVTDGGVFYATLRSTPHDLLVVPQGPGLAPRRVAGWQPTLAPPVAVDAGVELAGVVTDPTGTPLPGAQVALKVSGVPSTIATTDGAGAFAVRTVAPIAGDQLEVTVVPPSGSPWPRLGASLVATGAAAPLTIAYAPSLTTRSLAGVVVEQGGAPAADVEVVVVGTHADAGTVGHGVVTASATGTTRRSAVTDTGGALPAVAVVAAEHAAVIRAASGTVVAALDLTASVPATIAGPPATPFAVRVVDADGAALPGVVVTAIARGALALAGPTTRTGVTDGSGAVSWPGVPGATWDVIVEDPAARAARRELAEVANDDLGAVALPRALRISGRVAVPGGSAVSAAAVTLYCELCSGIDRQRPVASARTGVTGAFTLAVPDPGVAP
ncbi:MAG: carboxypeptidase-like regulatory domain-containing protein [Kofleriaceae bacterium]